MSFRYGRHGVVSDFGPLFQLGLGNACEVAIEFAELVHGDLPVSCIHDGKSEKGSESGREDGENGKLTVPVDHLEEGLGKELDPVGEVGDSGASGDQAAPHVEPFPLRHGFHFGPRRLGCVRSRHTDRNLSLGFPSFHRSRLRFEFVKAKSR